MIPFTQELLDARARRSSAGTCWGRRYRRPARERRARTSASGTAAAGDADLLLSRPEFETRRSCRWSRAAARPVSSSRIRQLVAPGSVAEAADAARRAVSASRARWSRAPARGRELDMPTANLEPAPDVVVPAAGDLRGAWRARRGVRMPAAVNIGVRPTFEARATPKVEAHLIGYEGDLYGRAAAALRSSSGCGTRCGSTPLKSSWRRCRTTWSARCAHRAAGANC